MAMAINSPTSLLIITLSLQSQTGHQSSMAPAADATRSSAETALSLMGLAKIYLAHPFVKTVDPL